MNTVSKITDLVNLQIDVSAGTCDMAQQILEILTPFYQELTKEGNICANSFATLVDLVKKIISFETKFFKAHAPTLNTIVDQFSTFDELKNLFKNFSENLPSTADLVKISKSKLHKPFLDVLASKNSTLNYWFMFPYTYVASWSVFWKQVLEVIPIDDGYYSIYQKCLSELKKIEFETKHVRVAQQFKDKLAKLYKISDKQKVFIPKNSPLIWCLSGFHVTTPSNIPANLFIFEDRVVLFRKDNLIISSKLLNTWIIESSMYPAEQNVVAVLGTKQSYAFQLASEADATALWQTWNSVATWCPSDWSIFTPVIVKPDEEDDIFWEAVYK